MSTLSKHRSLNILEVFLTRAGTNSNGVNIVSATNGKNCGELWSPDM